MEEEIIKIIGDYIRVNVYGISYDNAELLDQESLDNWYSILNNTLFTYESEDEYIERLLREKAITRENKINQILGE